MSITPRIRTGPYTDNTSSGQVKVGGTDVSLFLRKDAHLSVLFVRSLPRNQTLTHDDMYDIEQSRIGLSTGLHTYQIVCM